MHEEIVIVEPFFDREWYLSNNPDVAEAGVDAVIHYLVHGWREGRRPIPTFDPVWYLTTYRDVASLDIDPFCHFIKHGQSEGRQPSAEYNECAPEVYLLPIKQETYLVSSELIYLVEELIVDNIVADGGFFPPRPTSVSEEQPVSQEKFIELILTLAASTEHRNLYVSHSAN